jgi:hypothetical protein
MKMINHLSFSSVSKYLKCHRQWKHKYIDGWEEPTNDNLLFGSAWHEMIRASMNYHGAYDLSYGWDEAIHNILDVDTGMMEENHIPLYELGAKMASVESIQQAIKSLQPMPESIEKEIELHIPGVEVPIIGYIDMIEDGTNIPIDFKTAARKWPVNRADTELQATFYIAALEQAGMITLPHTFRYIVFTKTSKPTVQIFDTVRTAYDVFELHEMVNDVWHGIQSGAFGKCDPGNWWCSAKWCSFYDRCKNG